MILLERSIRELDGHRGFLLLQKQADRPVTPDSAVDRVAAGRLDPLRGEPARETDDSLDPALAGAALVSKQGHQR